ncbi:MAG: hypothetical protein AAF721_00325 [Myxococcota bacterium]
MSARVDRPHRDPPETGGTYVGVQESRSLGQAKARALEALGARGSSKWADLPELDRVRKAAAEVRSIAFEVQGIAQDARCKSLGITLGDAVVFHQLATWAAYDAELFAWESDPSNARAEEIAKMKGGRREDLPVKVLRLLRTKPAPPSDDPTKYDRPKLLPRDAPPLPSAEVYIGWESYCSDFVRSRQRGDAKRAG